MLSLIGILCFITLTILLAPRKPVLYTVHTTFTNKVHRTWCLQDARDWAMQYPADTHAFIMDGDKLVEISHPVGEA